MQQFDPTSKKPSKNIGEIKFVSNFEILQRIKEEPDYKPLQTDSFPTINNDLNGFMPGELVVVTGPPGNGKTLFCQTLTKDFCNDGYIPIWFSYEVIPKFFLRRFARDAEDLNFFMPDPLIPHSINWTCEAIRQAKDKYESEVFFIDHLHFIFKASTSRNASLDIGEIIRDLKQVAIEKEVVIFIICHSTKAKVEMFDDVGMHSIRDSGLIACEADVVLFIFNRILEDKDENIRSDQWVKICKSRRTGIMFKRIKITKHGNYLVELEPEQKVNGKRIRYSGSFVNNSSKDEF